VTRRVTKRKTSKRSPRERHRLRQTPQQVFVLDSLRLGQRAVIESVMAGRHTLAVMPTGAGKSLC
jgi:ATP-dependent DNA helicase RecQ